MDGFSFCQSLYVRKQSVCRHIRRYGCRQAQKRKGRRDHGDSLGAAVDRAVGELLERLRLTGEQVQLFERVLLIQAEQSLRSAESGYAAGNLNSLDLLDAERVLLDVRTGIERARADHAIALARLEGAVGAPLDETEEGASS